jgi:hypothetical protein
MIKVHKKEDGLWIEFTGIGGKSATLNVASLAEKYGPITGAAIILACAEAALSASAPAPAPEMVAAAIAHRACHSAEHDPQKGMLHGYCIVCGVPWPCDTAKQFLAPAPVPGEVVESNNVCTYCKKLHTDKCNPLLCPHAPAPLTGHAYFFEGRRLSAPGKDAP